MKEKDFDTCPRCGALIEPTAAACPHCHASAASAAVGAAPTGFCQSCRAPVASGALLCSACQNSPPLELAIEPPRSAASASASASGSEPCPSCGKAVGLSLETCPSCGASLLFDLALEGRVSSNGGYSIAAAISRLGPPAPSFDEIQQALRQIPPVLVRGVTREWAAAAIVVLQRNGVSATVGHFPLEAEAPRARPFPVKAVASVAVVVLLLGLGWLQSRRWAREHEPKRSFAAQNAAAAAAQPAPTPTPTPIATPDQVPTPAPATAPASGTGPAVSLTPGNIPSNVPVLVWDGLVFGGRDAGWWRKRLQALRTSTAPEERALYPLAKARAERAGLKVEEQPEVVSVEPNDVVRKQVQEIGAKP